MADEPINRRGEPVSGDSQGKDHSSLYGKMSPDLGLAEEGTVYGHNLRAVISDLEQKLKADNTKK